MMACCVGYGAYRYEVVDHAVPVRVIGPEGRPRKQISRAASWVWDRYGPAEAKRWLSGLLHQLNVVHDALPEREADRYDVAERFVASVADCRRMQDRFVAALGVTTAEAWEGDGSYWVKPGRAGYARIADAVAAGALATRALTIAGVFVGQDPSKVDREFSRIDGKAAELKLTRSGLRMDVDNRIRMGPDPGCAPRYEDPRLYDRLRLGLQLVGAPEPVRLACALGIGGGGRAMSVLSLTIHDLLVGSRRKGHYPSLNKSDEGEERSFTMVVPASVDRWAFAWMGGGRARLSGRSIEELRLLAADPMRRDELKAMPLLTEDGETPLTYNRLWRCFRRAAERMDLSIEDDAPSPGGRKRWVTFHWLRHEYVHRRLDRVDAMKSETERAKERAAIIEYMKWRSPAMLAWYSKHHVVKNAMAAAERHNEEQDAALATAALAPSGMASNDWGDEIDETMAALG